MAHQITPNDSPGPANSAQAMNIDRFAVFDAQINLVKDSSHVLFSWDRLVFDRQLVNGNGNLHFRRYGLH